MSPDILTSVLMNSMLSPSITPSVEHNKGLLGETKDSLISLPWRFEHQDFCALLSTQCRARYPNSRMPNLVPQHHNQHKSHSRAPVAGYPKASLVVQEPFELSGYAKVHGPCGSC